MENSSQVSKTLGITLKKLRLQHHMTLQDMAEKTDLSAGFLSKVERNLSNPSINNLQKICYALNITVNDLAAPEESDPGETDEILLEGEHAKLHRKENRLLIYNLNGNIKLESIFSNMANFKLDAMTLTGSEAGYMSSKHRYDEVGVVSSGRIALKIEEQDEYELGEGDAILIPANTEHTVRKLSDETSVSYWIKVIHSEEGHN